MENFCSAPFIEGCGTGAGLIIAIGAQNAFVLKQGILKNYVFTTVSICAVIDAILIGVGVGGLGAILTSNLGLLTFARWGGVLFLLYYGLRSFRSIFKAEAMKPGSDLNSPDLKRTIGTVLALSLLNPHVYLDTVVLVGSIGAQFPPSGRLFFALGAMFSSFVWFFGLGYGAAYLAPLFQKPLAWKILEFLTGCILWTIAISLILWTPGCL